MRPEAPSPARFLAVALAALAAALAGSIAARSLFGAVPATGPAALALDLVCAAVAGLAWVALGAPLSPFRDLTRAAKRRPLLALWSAADLFLLFGAATAGFGKAEVEPAHWRAVAGYAVARSVLLALGIAASKARPAKLRTVAIAVAFAGVVLALVAPSLWRSAATAGALALFVSSLALGKRAFARLAPAAGAALPALALIATAWLPGAAPLSWASPVASASTLVALGLAALALAAEEPA